MLSHPICDARHHEGTQEGCEQKAINNLNYMLGQIKGAKKGKGANNKRIKHCLQREDSSDDDEQQAAVPALTW